MKDTHTCYKCKAPINSLQLPYCEPTDFGWLCRMCRSVWQLKTAIKEQNELIGKHRST